MNNYANNVVKKTENCQRKKKHSTRVPLTAFINIQKRNSLYNKKPFEKILLKKIAEALFGMMVFTFFTVFIIFSEDISALSLKGAATVLYAVLPSTFPYLVLSGILMGTSLPHYIGKALSPLTNFFKIPSHTAFILLAAMISGFPLPSSIAYDLFEKGTLSRDECERIAAFCSFCGPPFILSLFGIRIMGDITAGVVCFAVQCVLSVILGRLLGKGAGEYSLKSDKKSNDTSLSLLICESISNSGMSMLKITSFVIFFSILSGIIKKLILLLFPSLAPVLTSVICGFLEISTGITFLSSLDVSQKVKFILGCSYIYWSGLSVFFQVASTMKGNISMKKYLLGRVFTVIFGTPLAYFIYFCIL